jgi:hypothetical protein
MNALMSARKTERNGSTFRSRVTTTVRFFKVGHGPALAGAMVLDGEGRTVHCTPDVPADVILKVLFRFTRRDETHGEVASSKDGIIYAWQVLGREQADKGNHNES